MNSRGRPGWRSPTPQDLGARAATGFQVDGLNLLAIPQLASDVPDAPPDMNGGDSDTDLLLFVRDNDRYVPFSKIPAPGGEDAEFFSIGPAIVPRSGEHSLRCRPVRVLDFVHHPRVVQPGLSPSSSRSRRTQPNSGSTGRSADVTSWRWRRVWNSPHVPGPNRDSVIYEWDGSRVR